MCSKPNSFGETKYYIIITYFKSDGNNFTSYFSQYFSVTVEGILKLFYNMSEKDKEYGY